MQVCAVWRRNSLSLRVVQPVEAAQTQTTSAHSHISICRAVVPAARYVTRERVEAMLDYEFLQCNLTLRTQRGDKTAFFAFADTLTTKVWLPSSHSVARRLIIYSSLSGTALPCLCTIVRIITT